VVVKSDLVRAQGVMRRRADRKAKATVPAKIERKLAHAAKKRVARSQP
jgi:hypothetical protein